MRKQWITKLSESAIMVALAFALSCAQLFKMPLGGSVTVGSMLPIMFIGIKYGSGVGLGAGFVYSLTQVLQALIEGNVFPYCETGGTLVICVLFDYVIPFTLLGLAGIFKKMRFGVYYGMLLVVFIRFLSHFITGVAIWGQWAPDGMGKYLYSFLYNGGFLLFDFLIAITLAFLMLRNREIRSLLLLDKKQAE